MHITVIGAGNWILATLRIVEFSHVLSDSLDSGHRVRSLFTLLSFMGTISSDVVMVANDCATINLLKTSNVDNSSNVYHDIQTYSM